jgi:lipopolysaccharide/colanic/teichoic acid biosynthesis glycosyltransferase
MEMNFQTVTANNEGVLCVRVTSDQYDKFQLLQQQFCEKKLQMIGKRTFDIFVSSVLIFLLSPILIVVTLLVKLTSRGPAFYTNERVGLNGDHFNCFKFRSMVVNHAIKHDDHKKAIKGQENGILHKSKTDSRITFIGKIIRKTSIDELPQLFNVLKGDMSIIGPRPLVPFMLKPFPEFSKIRCLVKPGITGLWQIRDREHNTSAEFMIEHDTEYIENYSLMQDLKILVGTPVAVLSARGAY